VAGKYRKFTPEFREEAARMVVETSRPIADVARELGINETSLGNWVRAYREKHAGDEPPLQYGGSRQRHTFRRLRGRRHTTARPGLDARLRSAGCVGIRAEPAS